MRVSLISQDLVIIFVTLVITNADLHTLHFHWKTLHWDQGGSAPSRWGGRGAGGAQAGPGLMEEGCGQGRVDGLRRGVGGAGLR